MNNQLDNAVQQAVTMLVDNMRIKVMEVHGDHWSHRQETAKSVLTVTAAIIVATVSFSGSIIGKEEPLTLYATLLLTSSWFFLALSVVFAMRALWKIYCLSTIGPLFFNKRKVIGAYIHEKLNLLPQDEYKDKLKDIAPDISKLMLDEVTEKDKASHKAMLLQMIFFSISILTFAAFGIIRVAYN